MPPSFAAYLLNPPDEDLEVRKRAIFKSLNPHILQEVAQSYADIEHLAYLPLTKQVVLAGPVRVLQELASHETVTAVDEDEELFLCGDSVLDAIGVTTITHSLLAPTGQGVIIALLDSGIDTNCPDLHGTVAGQKCFIQESSVLNTHGTAMAGVIAGRGDPVRGGHRGIAPASTFIDTHVFDSMGMTFKSNILEALAWITPQAPSIVVFGGATLHAWGEGDFLAETCQQVADAGSILVAPVGNWGPESNTVGSPACTPAVIAVGAVTQEGGPAFFSSRGPGPDGTIKPDVVLPGVKITTVAGGSPVGDTLEGGSMTQLPYLTGTSAATAIFAGLAALIMENRRDVDPEGFRNAAIRAAEDLKLQPETQGHGIVNGATLTTQLGLLFPHPAPWRVVAWFALLVALISSGLVVTGLILLSIFR